MKVGKRYKECLAAVDSTKLYEPAEALDLVTKTAKAKFRYRQPDVDVLVRFISEDVVEVKCFDKVRAITPGQMAVFYDNDVCLGGGVIEEVL